MTPMPVDPLRVRALLMECIEPQRLDTLATMLGVCCRGHLRMTLGLMEAAGIVEHVTSGTRQGWRLTEAGVRA